MAIPHYSGITRDDIFDLRHQIFQHPNHHLSPEVDPSKDGLTCTWSMNLADWKKIYSSFSSSGPLPEPDDEAIKRVEGSTFGGCRTKVDNSLKVAVLTSDYTSVPQVRFTFN